MTSQAGKSSGSLTPTGVTIMGVIANTVLGGSKLLAGLLFNSQAILADGLHSISDLATDLAVLAGIRISSRPADESHHYGHRRAMTLTTALLGLGLLAAGGLVGYGALRTFTEDIPPPVRAILPLALAVASVVIKEALYHLTVRVGRRARDTSVVANAWHHRSDAMTSVAAAAGLTVVLIGGKKWHFMDHATALVLACFLAVVAWRILREAAADLMDRAPSQAVTDEIQQAIAQTSGVRSFHAFRARKLGEMVEMDIHVQVDGDIAVSRGHDIATEVRQRVEDCCPNVISVIVHVEPFEG